MPGFLGSLLRSQAQCLLEAIALSAVFGRFYLPAPSSFLSWQTAEDFTKQHTLNSIWFISAGGITNFQPASGEKADARTVFLGGDSMEEPHDSYIMGQLGQRDGNNLGAKYENWLSSNKHLVFFFFK